MVEGSGKESQSKKGKAKRGAAGKIEGHVESTDKGSSPTLAPTTSDLP